MKKKNSIIPNNEGQESLQKGNFYFERNNYEMAIKQYSNFYQITKDEQICLKLAECHFFLNQFEQSLSYIDQISETNFSNPQVIRIKGLALYNLDQIEASEHFLKQTNQQIPNDETIQEKYNIVLQILNIHQLFCKQHLEKINQFNIIKNIPLQQRLICKYCYGDQSLVSLKSVLESIQKKDSKNFDNINDLELYIKKERQRYYLNFEKQYRVIQQVTNTIVECQRKVQKNFEMLLSVTKQFKKISPDDKFTSFSAICLAELVSENENQIKLCNIKGLLNELNNKEFQLCQTWIQNMLPDLDLNFEDQQQQTISIKGAKDERKLSQQGLINLKKHSQYIKQLGEFDQAPQSFAYFNYDSTKVIYVQNNQIKRADIVKKEHTKVATENLLKNINQFTIRLDETIFIAAENNGYCILWTMNDQSQYTALIISSEWKYIGVQLDQTINTERFYSWQNQTIYIWQKVHKWDCLLRISTDPLQISAFTSSDMNIFAYGEKMLKIVELREGRFKFKTIKQNRSSNQQTISQISLVKKSSQSSDKQFICLIFEKKNIELWRQDDKGNVYVYFYFKVDYVKSISFIELKENYLISLSKDYIYLYQFDLDLENLEKNNKNLKYQFSINSDINQEVSQIISIPKSNAKCIFYLSCRHSLLIPISKFSVQETKIQGENAF